MMREIHNCEYNNKKKNEKKIFFRPKIFFSYLNFWGPYDRFALKSGTFFNIEFRDTTKTKNMFFFRKKSTFLKMIVCVLIRISKQF